MFSKELQSYSQGREAKLLISYTRKMSAYCRPVIAALKKFETSSVVWVIMIAPNMAQMHTAPRRIDHNFGSVLHLVVGKSSHY
jgi:predicted deacetylase